MVNSNFSGFTSLFFLSFFFFEMVVVAIFRATSTVVGASALRTGAHLYLVRPQVVLVPYPLLQSMMSLIKSPSGRCLVLQSLPVTRQPMGTCMRSLAQVGGVAKTTNVKPSGSRFCSLPDTVPMTALLDFVLSHVHFRRYSPPILQ